MLKGHWGHSKTGYYYNGLHHDDVLKGSHLGIDCKTVALISEVRNDTDVWFKIGRKEAELLVVVFCLTM